MVSKLSAPIGKFTSTIFWYYVKNILVVGLLFYCIKSLTDYDNVYYQTWKNEAAAKAILAFTAIIFIIRKVKLLNWQSLVTTLLFGAVFYERMHFWADAEDIWNAVKPQMAAEWMTLMIIIDIVLYKNVNDLFKKTNYLLILYIVMTIGMILRRHDRLDPIILIFPMFLFALVKMDEEETEWFMRRFIDGWFISFVYVLVKSFKNHPYDGGRYYGCFLNIGPFGIFMACCFTIIIIALYYIKENYGRLSFPYFITWIWLLFDLYMLYLIDSRTSFSGILFCLAFLYLFMRKNSSRSKIIYRSVLLIVLFVSLFVLAFLAFSVCSKICSDISDEWLQSHSTGIWIPITTIIERFRWVTYKELYHSSGNRLFDIFDALSSWRLTIWNRYFDFFNYDGNSSIGFEIDDGYWVYSAHNTYIQFLVEYGYLSLAELLLTIFVSIFVSVKSYLCRSSRAPMILPGLWLVSMLGIWIGESNTFFYPITFFGFMFIARMLPQAEK